jgi:hypothetical protein
MADDYPQPGNNVFTADQEQAMRQGRARTQAALQARMQQSDAISTPPSQSQLADQIAARRQRMNWNPGGGSGP